MDNSQNLMHQLQKIKSIAEKKLGFTISEILFIIDANTGKNGIIQAESFHKFLNLTGIILTKLDGSSKGGIVLSIKEELNLPVKFVGVGEKITDLKVFEIQEYVNQLFSNTRSQ
jgi:fused signal recognition particle receptor